MPTAEYLDPRKVPFGREITRTIEEFAESRSLIFRPHYHDLAIWIIHERELSTAGTQAIKQLQVGACEKDLDLFLLFIPSVYLLDFRARKMRVPRKTPNKFLSKLSFKKLATEEGFQKKKLLASLGSSWEASAELQGNLEKGRSSGIKEVNLSERASHLCLEEYTGKNNDSTDCATRVLQGGISIRQVSFGGQPDLGPDLLN